MPADTCFLHPGLVFIAAALIYAFVPQRLNTRGLRTILLVAPAAAIYAAFTNNFGNYLEVTWLGQVLTLGRLDAMSGIFVQVFAIMSLAGLVFALHVDDKWQQVAAMFYVAGGFGCVLAGDYITLFVFWEIMAIGSTLLVMANRTTESIQAGFRYFLYHVLGGLFLLAGLLLRYHALGTFEFTAVPQAGAQLYDWLILIGFCVNAAVVPLHAWLPDAYPRGTVTGSVFMCAFTTKTAVYVLMRGFAGWDILAAAGTVMAVYGVLYASMENNARRILSYHIVSQVGYMVAGIGVGAALTINGAAAHAYAHILYKGLLFMSVGAVLYSAGTAKLDELGGLAARLPYVMILYMVAALSISGMPVFNGFVSKTMTIAGAAEAHRTWVALGLEIAAVGTFLSVGLKLPYFAFWGGKETDLKRALKPVPCNMYWGMAILAVLCVAQGLFPEALLYKYLPVSDAAFAYKPWTVWSVLQTGLLLGFTGLAFYFMRHVITPHKGQNLDFDYFYRLIGRAVLAIICRPAAVIDRVWGEAYTLGVKVLKALGFATSIFDRQVIDGVVDGSAYAVGFTGRVGAMLQNGRLQEYLGLMFILIMGALGVLMIYFLIY